MTVNFHDERRADRHVDHLHRVFEHADLGIQWVLGLQDQFGPLQWSLQGADRPNTVCRQCTRRL